LTKELDSKMNHNACMRHEHIHKMHQST